MAGFKAKTVRHGCLQNGAQEQVLYFVVDPYLQTRFVFATMVTTAMLCVVFVSTFASLFFAGNGADEFAQTPIYVRIGIAQEGD